LDAAADVEDFLARFPADQRAEQALKYQEEIDLLRIERKFARRSRQLTRDGGLLPIERDYIEAINQMSIDPQRTADELRALVAVYSNADIKDERTQQVLEVARRQLARLDHQALEQSPAYLEVIDRSLSRAKKLRNTDKKAAVQIWQSIVTLYGDKPWAKDRVRKAREELASAYSNGE
jgi:hypothetical protein